MDADKEVVARANRLIGRYGKNLAIARVIDYYSRCSEKMRPFWMAVKKQIEKEM